MSKGAYIGVNGVARKIKRAYVGVNTELPIYEGEIVTTNITGDNIGDFFTVSNIGYDYFVGNGNAFVSNNYGDEDTVANSLWTAKFNMTQVSFDYSVSSESGWDKLTIRVGGIDVVSGISGEQSGSWIGGLEAGQTIELIYSKDGSVDEGTDRATISNIVVTQDNRVIVNSDKQNVARRIKKAYVGVGGVARPCWTGGELAYYGKATSLTTSRYQLAATSVGNYALFGGGYASNGNSGTVDAYDKSLTRTAPTVLSSVRRELSATTVGNYAVFGGGNGASTAVDAYDTSLTRTTPTAFSVGRYYTATTTVGNFALFCGGYNGSSPATTVDAYDTSLTRTTPTVLSTARYYLAATTVGGCALFGGGLGNGSTYHATVDAYDTSLTRTNPTELSKAREYFDATTVGNYALFGGGYGQSGTYYVSFNTVDAYDRSLTRSQGQSLSKSRHYLSATTVGDYALFGGGKDDDTNPVSTVDAYDSSLTRTIPTGLSAARQQLASTTVGDFALFGGGRTSGYSNTVDVYTVL